MKQWKGPANFTCLEAESDLRVGGRYRLVMRGTPPPRNGEPPQERTSTVTGEYLEVRPPEFVRYSWNADWSPGEQSVVTLRLHEENGGTRLELRARRLRHDRVRQRSQPRLERCPRQARCLRRALR